MKILVTRIMNHPMAYNLWQAPFVEKKLAPLRKYADLQNARRVLDVGCGPGTNAGYFKHCEYLGLDWNQSYIDYARRRYKQQFIVTDICKYTPPPKILYDFILVNSFLHHVDDDRAMQILSKLNTLLDRDGHIHILDLVMPSHFGVGRVLAQSDRGQFPRAIETWRQFFSEIFVPVIFEPYGLNVFGVTLWNMVYFKGRAK